VEDRWAIIAYLRALQKSETLKLDQLSPEQKAQLEKK
jgi:hypothetical protein